MADPRWGDGGRRGGGVKERHYQQNDHLVEQTQGCLIYINLVRSGVSEQKSRGGTEQTQGKMESICFFF